jgi:hypothetical protein
MIFKPYGKVYEDICEAVLWSISLSIPQLMI